MAKCPNCGKEIIIDYGNDIEATMWNFDGDSAEIEMYVYCENCNESFKISVPAKIDLDLEKIEFLETD